jgi:uncharacterized protein YihD (DUF1040 family)
MRDPKRIDEILEVIGNLWKEHPDIRLCQLLSNKLYEINDLPSWFFYLEDDKLLEVLEKEKDENDG